MSKNCITISSMSIFVAIILLFCSSCINSSKLNEVVLRSIDQVFHGNNNLSSNATNFEGNGKNSNFWENEGFISANATQITSSFGSTIGISTKLLLATKASSLSTQMTNFAHTFLVIKFSSIIGHTERQMLDASSSTTVSYPVEETTFSPEVRGEFHSSTLSYPHDSTSEMFANGEYNEKLAKIQKLIEQPPEQNMSPKVSPHPPPPSPQPSAILKLNADGSDGHQVIEIALDPETFANDGPLPSGFKMTQKSDETSVNGGTNEPDALITPPPSPPPAEISFDMNMRANRRKRELNSEEMISQIHKILTITNNMKNKDTKLKPKLKTVQEEIISAQDVEKAEELVKEEELMTADKPSFKGLNSAKKLSYQTWRASMDKSFRPPGFYVTVDEKVVFDNFEGVWQSSTSPTVMGRWSSPKKNGIWNDTAIMLQFDEIPDKNIKISFEWEPIDPTAYLFISNISISTYGANASDANIGPQYSGDSNNIFGGASNRNITLFVVLKTPSAEHVIKMGDKPEVVEQRVVQIQPNISTNFPSATTMTPKPILKKKPVPSKFNPLSSGGNTGLIVACITGCFAVVILIFLLHKKLQIKKSPNRPSRPMYIDEL